MTENQAHNKMAEILTDHKNTITAYTYNNSPEPQYVIRNVETAKYDIGTLNGQLFHFDCDSKLSDVVWVYVDLYYLLSPGLSSPEATDRLLVLCLDNRWFVADSDLISEVFADSFSN